MENDNNKKDVAKEKIILFVIGVLIGAVISTAAFFVCTKTIGVCANNSDSSSQQTPGGTPPEMPSGENGQNSQSNTPPEKPGEGSNQNNTSTEKSSGNNSESTN